MIGESVGGPALWVLAHGYPQSCAREIVGVLAREMIIEYHLARSAQLSRFKKDVRAARDQTGHGGRWGELRGGTLRPNLEDFHSIAPNRRLYTGKFTDLSLFLPTGLRP